MRLIIVAVATIALVGCSREEEPVADRFDRQKAEIENKAQALEAQVENEVSAAEARLDNEADALLESFANVSGNAGAAVENGVDQPTERAAE